MSTQRPSRQISVVERARHIRAAYNKHGRPPSMKMAGRESDRHHHDAYTKAERPWDDILREEAGVPGYGDVIARAIRELFAERYEWQAFVEFTSSDIANESGLSHQITSRVVRAFVAGERDHDALDGLAVIDTGMGSPSAKYRVERASEEGSL